MKPTETAFIKAMDSLVVMNTKLLETVAVLQKQLDDAQQRNNNLFPVMLQIMMEKLQALFPPKPEPFPQGLIDDLLKGSWPKKEPKTPEQAEEEALLLEGAKNMRKQLLDILREEKTRANQAAAAEIKQQQGEEKPPIQITGDLGSKGGNGR